MFDELLVFPLTSKAARIADDMQRQLRDNGAEIDPEETMIAGIAEDKDLPVLTKNTDHFERLDIDVKTY
jgi:predicted nucleic acid-binding protein